MKLRIALAACLWVCWPSLATAQSAQGLDALNAQFAQLWDRLLPDGLRALDTEGRAALAALQHQSGNTTVSVKEVRAIRPSISAPPGLTHLDPQAGVGVRVPKQGRWAIELEAVVRIKTKVLFARPTFDIPVRLIVEDLRLEAHATFDWTDPDRPTVAQVAPPQVDFRVKLRSRNLFYGLLLRLLSPIGNRLAHKAVAQALVQLTPTLQALQGVPGAVPGDGAAALVDSGQPTEIETVVANIQRKIAPINMPHGRIVRAIMDTPSHDSWDDAYGPNGTGVQGAVVDYHDGGDSPIWTGHFLASQALRYRVTGDSEALDLIRRGIWGLTTVLDVNGASGLLAREAAPASSIDGQRLMQRPYRSRLMHGETWVTPEHASISRDQYLGAFMGFGIVHQFVTDPAIRAECRTRITQMLDYLIAHDWWVDEDRPPVNLTGNGGFPTFWVGVGKQKVTYLLLGERVAPGRYASELTAAAPLLETAWFTDWTSSWNMDSHYKFNLGHGNFYLYFLLETDPARWQHVERARRINYRYVGHHHNAHFDLVHCSVDPSLHAVKFPEVRQALRLFLRRMHRQVAPAVVDLSHVQYHTIQMPVITLPGQQSKPSTVTLPTAPIDIHLRPPTGDFLWQRSAFAAARPGHGDPRTEQPGIDLLLPYWMGRYLGAF